MSRHRNADEGAPGRDPATSEGSYVPTPATPATPTGTMPGWHIVSDLTPPELIASRRLRKVRVAVIAAVALVIAGAGAGYYAVRDQAQDAAATVASEQARSETLRAQQSQYSNVTALQVSIDQANAELATLMTSDVDTDELLGAIWHALPDGMTIGQIAVTIPPQTSGASPEAASGRSGAGTLDTSEQAHIGTMTLSGTGTELNDVPAFIDRLRHIDGIFDPYPTSNVTNTDGAGDASDGVGQAGTTYSLQVTLTDALLTHLYATGGES